MSFTEHRNKGAQARIRFTSYAKEKLTYQKRNVLHISLALFHIYVLRGTEHGETLPCGYKDWTNIQLQRINFILCGYFAHNTKKWWGLYARFIIKLYHAYSTKVQGYLKIRVMPYSGSHLLFSTMPSMCYSLKPM